MRKKIVLICAAAAALVTLVGLRLFGFIGVGSGTTGVRGDPVRFSASSLALRLLKGGPDAAEALPDAPAVLWRYEDQAAFGRSCSIEYTLHRGGNVFEILFVNGVTGIEVEIPVADGEDGLRVADMVYEEMRRVCARKSGQIFADGWAPSGREGVLREASITSPSSALPPGVFFKLYADRVLIRAAWLV